MKPTLSARGDVKPFYAMDILAQSTKLRSEGKNVLSMAVGQPSAKAPEIVRRAAAEAAFHAPLGYTDALGRAETREAIAAHYFDLYGIKVPSSRIAVTTGSSAAFGLVFLALMEPGERIAIASPGYPAYRNIIKSLSLDVVEIPHHDSAAHAFDVDALVAAHRKKKITALLIASPANPTGTVIARGELQQIVETCDREGITLISDEIYHRLNHVADDVTALSLSSDVIVINSFSKYYCMTGWRIGWVVLPENMVRTVERLAQSLYICAPDLSQIAAPYAFQAGNELELVKHSYKANRLHLLNEFPKLGISFASPPDGAFYAWCDVSALTNDSMEFAHRMLEEINVAAAPGLDFDVENGARYMRFSYAASPEIIIEATGRIADWLCSR